MDSKNKHARREDYLREEEIKAKADLAELEHNSGGFLGVSNFLPKKGGNLGVLARLKVLNEADRPVEYGGLLSGKRGGLVMAVILAVLALLILVNMISRYL